MVAYLSFDSIYLHHFMLNCNIYSNKKDTSDVHGTVSIDPIKMPQQKIYQNVYQTSEHTKVGNYLISSSFLEELLNLK